MNLNPAPQKRGITGHTHAVSQGQIEADNSTEGLPPLGPCGKTELRRSSARCGQSQVVRAVGNQFVAESFANCAVFQQKNARHALHVSGGKAYKVSVEKRSEHAHHTFAIQILAKLVTHQSKRLVEPPLRIAETRNIHETIRRKKPLRFSLRAQMHESQRVAVRFYSLAFFGNFSDRLSAKSAAKMAKEHQEQWTLGGKRSERLPVLRGVGVKQRGVDLV